VQHQGQQVLRLHCTLLAVERRHRPGIHVMQRQEGEEGKDARPRGRRRTAAPLIVSRRDGALEENRVDNGPYPLKRRRRIYAEGLFHHSSGREVATQVGHAGAEKGGMTSRAHAGRWRAQRLEGGLLASAGGDPLLALSRQERDAVVGTDVAEIPSREVESAEDGRWDGVFGARWVCKGLGQGVASGGEQSGVRGGACRGDREVCVGRGLGRYGGARSRGRSRRQARRRRDAVEHGDCGVRLRLRCRGIPGDQSALLCITYARGSSEHTSSLCPSSSWRSGG
jgi:hypothetical protein